MPALPAACLFDLDGLLLDTEPLHSRGWSEAASHFGAQLSNDQLLQLKGRRRLDCASLVSSWLPRPVESDDLLAVQQPIVRALLPNAKAMPFAQELVEHWHVHDRQARHPSLCDIGQQSAQSGMRILRFLHGQNHKIIILRLAGLRRHSVHLPRQIARMYRTMVILAAQLDANFRPLAVDQFRSPSSPSGRN